MNAIIREEYEAPVLTNETIEVHLTYLRSGFDAVQAALPVLRDKIDLLSAKVDSKIEALNEKTNARIDAVHTSLSEKIEKTNDRIEAVIRPSLTSIFTCRPIAKPASRSQRPHRNTDPRRSRTLTQRKQHHEALAVGRQIELASQVALLESPDGQALRVARLGRVRREEDLHAEHPAVLVEEERRTVGRP